jgi:hypothetical protein
MRHAEIGIGPCALGEFGGCGGFHAQVEFQRDGLRQHVDNWCETQATRFGGEAFSCARGESERGEVSGEFLIDAGAQHLHRDAHRILARGFGFVHLRDGRRRDGFAEAREQHVDRLAELILDDFLRGWCRKRRETILQLLQRGCDLAADHVRAGRENLAELDVRRSKFFQRTRQTLARRRFDVDLAEAEHAARDAQRERDLRRVLLRHQRVVPRERARDAPEPREVRQRADHMRQAECSAAMPPARLRTFTRLRPAFSIIFANFACGGNLRMLSAR